MEGLPEHLPVGQVILKSYLPDLKIYLSRTTGRDFCRALFALPTLGFDCLHAQKGNKSPRVMGFD